MDRPGTMLLRCLLLSLLSGAGCAEKSPDETLDLDLGNGETLKLVLIPAGKFLMGSRLSAEEVGERFDEEAKYFKNEHPQHEVTISRAFYMGVYEVTQAQWRAVLDNSARQGLDPHSKPGPNNAVTWKRWDDAVEFCEALSKKTGRKVSLPTEAQWEYACRAGSKALFSFGDDASKLGDYDWYYETAWRKGEEYAHAVGQKKPNAWGLYDMHGNVAEWCSDWYDENFYAKAKDVDPENTTRTGERVIRGGVFDTSPDFCRSASRRGDVSHCVTYRIGFRVVVELD